MFQAQIHIKNWQIERILLQSPTNCRHNLSIVEIEWFHYCLHSVGKNNQPKIVSFHLRCGAWAKCLPLFFLGHQNNYWIEMIEVFGLDGSVISRAVHRSVCKVSKKQKLMNKSSDFWIIDFIELMLHQDFIIDLWIRIHVATNKRVMQLKRENAINSQSSWI